jgi:hypothetical protein
MRTMNIPGFTAEDSLYISRKQYSVTTTKFLAAKGDIQPQLRRSPSEDKTSGCVCVSPINCPCDKPRPWPPWPTDFAV